MIHGKKIFPRRKAGQSSCGREPGEAIVLNLQTLTNYFHVPLNTACQELGIGRSTMKRLCRKFGIASWPTKRCFEKLEQSMPSRSISPASMSSRSPSPIWMPPAAMNFVQEVPPAAMNFYVQEVQAHQPAVAHTPAAPVQEPSAQRVEEEPAEEVACMEIKLKAGKADLDFVHQMSSCEVPDLELPDFCGGMNLSTPRAGSGQTQLGFDGFEGGMGMGIDVFDAFDVFTAGSANEDFSSNGCEVGAFGAVSELMLMPLPVH